MEKAQHLMAVAKEMHDVAELPGSISSSRDFLRHQNTTKAGLHWTSHVSCRAMRFYKILQLAVVSKVVLGSEMASSEFLHAIPKIPEESHGGSQSSAGV